MNFLPFFVIIAAGVLFSALFNKFHLPWVLALIVSGMVIGPHGFEVLTVNQTLLFMGEIGLIFLMFMAGLEVRLTGLRELRLEVARFAVVNGMVPALAGGLLGWVLGFGWLGSLLLGIIFMSSSVAVIVPTLEAGGILTHKLGKIVVAGTVIIDIASLVLLAIVLQVVKPLTGLPIPSFILLLTIVVVGFRYALPRIRGLFPVRRDERDLFESEVRIVLTMLFGTVITFAALGLHPIVAGFFSGLILSDTINSEILLEKLRTIGYGIFIPVFFVLVGAETNIGVFLESAVAVSVALAVLVASLGSKFTSGFMAIRSIGFSVRDSVIAGVATTPQLSTTLAVVLTAVELQLIPAALSGAMVLLAIVSTLTAPVVLRYLFDHPDALKRTAT